jgi:hypothetical protein
LNPRAIQLFVPSWARNDDESEWVGPTIDNSPGLRSVGFIFTSSAARTRLLPAQLTTWLTQRELNN